MEIKVLQLNVWTGRLKGSLLKFFEENEFDIICLQEAIWAKDGSLIGQKQIENYAVTVEQIKNVSGLKYELRGEMFGVEVANGKDIMQQGNVILSRFKLIDKKVDIIYGDYNKRILFAKRKAGQHAYTVVSAKTDNGIFLLNYHGYWDKNPMGNKTTARLMERAVAGVPRNNEMPVIMCGDLNVIHQAPAMKKVKFLHDLTYEYKIKNTLNGLKFDGKVPCDHILVNDCVKVKSFEVTEKIISDHKGLIMKAVIDGK